MTDKKSYKMGVAFPIHVMAALQRQSKLTMTPMVTLVRQAVHAALLEADSEYRAECVPSLTQQKH